jgi:tripartite ATP-independent transporter DctM subunit
MLIDALPLLMFLLVCLCLMLGYPVAFTLAGTALLCAGLGIINGLFDANLLLAFPERIFGTISNYTLVAIPLFILMGVMLEKSKLAEELLDNMSKLFGGLPGGLGLAVIIVGMFLAACTGIVGATVVTMGLMSLPIMLKRGYSAELATGTICATGTLGQIIPPSIALVILGDILSNAYQQAQLQMGIFNPKPISVGDLFVGALIPGFILVMLYIIYLVFTAVRHPERAPAAPVDESISVLSVLASLLPPIILIFLVLGSIISGAATPTEAAGVGAIGATTLALIKGQLTFKKMSEVVRSTTETTAMVFMILIGASLFSLVFRGFGGEEMITNFFTELPGGVFSATLLVMLIIFLLGFILDFIEISLIVVPIVGPILLTMGIDPIWLGIMIALNLQTSFLTPPFGFALFYLRGVTPDNIPTTTIYKGVVPFIALQITVMMILAIWPQLATWLPSLMHI